MDRRNGILIPLLAIGVVLLLGYKGFGWENNNLETKFLFLGNLVSESPSNASNEAWTTLQNYLEFARTRNLPGIRSLSHQVSATCNDPSREKECFALMDSVYAFASQLKLSEFKHIQMDERQIIMFTDGPTVAILYFTKDIDGTSKVLGLRFCLEDETVQERCIETGSIRHDEDGDGWWDSVESLFYN